MLQTRPCLLYAGLSSEQREVDSRVGVVPGYFNIGEGDHADAGILQLQPDDAGQLALDLLGDAPATGEILRHLEGTGDLDDFVHLELVTDLEIVEVLQRKAAFESGLDLAHVVLEALQGVELAVVDHHVVA